ncbi:N-acetyltransferase [Nocardioides baekrokdamisoli]|uniref:N-acetyltransferase n=1 Tax=Nocardioides baekrokdamisoli TaxID=1804624 RepID=A0A3G9IRX2_9ACTN|nr:GNAT family N-acetyltransferase [Nocardioides baekrokdamisoli]BBH16371.1 N-acetyltransferase [Nocardioides baekrokdamisoli]
MEIERADGFVMSDDRTRLDLDRIVAWLGESYWAPTRSRETIERSIEHSVAYGVYDSEGVQVAFYRAVTDFATFGWICDVWVGPHVRGRGIGVWMIEEGVRALAAAGVPRLALATLDAHGVYLKAGFAPLAHPERWMDIDRRDVIP